MTPAGADLVRRLRDRVRPPKPHDAEPAAEAPAPPAPAPIPSETFHVLLHELRTVALEAAPKGARVAASIGASGRWYFDWFENSVGPLEVHIGVEAYEPEPDDLPPYVRWLRATADHLESIDSASVDLVYAGQTAEHLWASELTGFLLGARRILRPDGWLVLDSPNRLVTEHLRWSHGGHTVELSTGEMEELLALAGFTVRVRRGLWRCRFGDRVLELEEGLDDPALTLRRSLPGAPDDCFVWWIEAQPDGSPAVDEASLRRRVDELYDTHWPTRVCRGMWPGPGADALAIPAGASGSVATSLPFPLHEGRWTLTLRVTEGRLEDLSGAELVLTAPGGETFASLSAADGDVSGDGGITWEFAIPFFLQALVLELRVQRTAAPVALAMPLPIRCVGTG